MNAYIDVGMDITTINFRETTHFIFFKIMILDGDNTRLDTWCWAKQILCLFPCKFQLKSI
jgi:hypothetical protein